MSADLLLELHEAGRFADELLAGLRLPIAKSLQLGTPRGFDRAVALVAARLREAAGIADVEAVRQAVSVLDVNWPNTTADQRRRLVSEAMVAAGRATSVIPARIQAPLNDAAQAVVSATRSDVRSGQGLPIGVDFNALDGRVTAHVVRSQGKFVRDEYGRRVDSFGAEARRIVADGLEQGLGRDDIAADLERAARHALIERAPAYWEVVAGAFIGQGRSFAQLSSYAEAGISRYRIEAVLDERTTHVCRFMHGKTFAVDEGLRRFDQLEKLENPEDVKRAQPWIRERRDSETGRSQLYVGDRTLAEVTRSGIGSRDDRGEFRSGVSDGALGELGVGFPPYHGLCRTTTVAVV